MSYVVRPWALRDLKDVVRLIREGATFHKALDQVKTTPEVLREDGFGMDPKFGCLVAEVPPDQRSKDGHTVVGYQFHYFSYCTWTGRIVFGEDLYVMPEFRGKGIGTSLLSQVAKLALAHGCTQFRFVLANWNQPAMALYEKLGAIDVTARDNWVVWHIEGRAMRELAERAIGEGEGMECVLRPCRAEDCAEVMRMIKELAEFEELPDQVQISDQVLREDGFANDPFYRCLVAEVPPEHRSQDGHTVVGYGLYFFTYSTWKGRNIYMEDLYVMPEFRGKGIGKKLMSKIAEIGVENRCTQLKFVVLDWNRTAIDFYQGQGAVDLTTAEGWHFFHVEGDALKQLAQGQLGH